MRYGPTYQRACELQETAVMAAQRPSANGMSIAALLRAWCEVESMKRRMRGVPELGVHKLKELADSRFDRAKRLSTQPAPSFTELDAEPEPSKESLSQGQTVTTPPPPEAPKRPPFDK